jgi:hypothetical protein
MRLVPDQDPNKVADLFEAYLKKIAPKTVEVALVADFLARLDSAGQGRERVPASD